MVRLKKEFNLLNYILYIVFLFLLFYFLPFEGFSEKLAMKDIVMFLCAGICIEIFFRGFVYLWRYYSKFLSRKKSRINQIFIPIFIKVMNVLMITMAIVSMISIMIDVKNAILGVGEFNKIFNTFLFVYIPLFVNASVKKFNFNLQMKNNIDMQILIGQMYVFLF